jgi:hypothetical protein
MGEGLGTELAVDAKTNLKIVMTCHDWKQRLTPEPISTSELLGADRGIFLEPISTRRVTWLI